VLRDSGRVADDQENKEHLTEKDATAGDAYNRSVPRQFARMGDSMTFIVTLLRSSLDHSRTRAAVTATTRTTTKMALVTAILTTTTTISVDLFG
jgi:hypothetical protein